MACQLAWVLGDGRPCQHVLVVPGGRRVGDAVTAGGWHGWKGACQGPKGTIGAVNGQQEVSNVWRDMQDGDVGVVVQLWGLMGANCLVSCTCS